MDFSSTSLEGILARLTTAIEGLSDGGMEKAAIPYTLVQLLETAIDNHASLLHINAGSTPMLRINEQLVPVGEHKLTRGDCLKLLKPLLTREQRTELYSGNEIEMCFPASGTGFRLNLYMERGNLSASIRRLRSDIPNLTDLGISGGVFEQLLMEPSGLILLTGSPRCGKINTLAALIAHICNNRNVRIISLEQPIQFWHQNSLGTVIQREVGVDTVSFAQGVQQAVLQDPDVIALTDLPDKETAEFAIRAAAGGHLVLATLDATSSVRALERLTSTFLDSNNSDKALNTLAKALRLVLYQTLVPHAETMNMLPVFEILVNTEEVRRELRHGNVDRLYSIMVQNSMQTLGKALGRLVSSGTITREVALQFVSTPSELDQFRQDDTSNTAAGNTPISSENPLISWL